MVQHHKEENKNRSKFYGEETNLVMLVIKFWDILTKSVDFPLRTHLAVELPQTKRVQLWSLNVITFFEDRDFLVSVCITYLLLTAYFYSWLSSTLHEKEKRGRS